MSLVTQPMRLKFDGTPLTGVLQPKVVLHTGELTIERMDYVRRAYNLFCLAKSVAVTDYFVTNREMKDGTRIRITSFMGDDLVHVWASGGEKSQMLPHGFVVAVADLKPRLYNTQTGKAGKKWFVGGTAPQIRKNSSMYSQILRLSGGKEPKDMVLPIVYSYVNGPTWDYWRHGGPVGDTSLKLPFAIDRNVGGDEPLSFHDLHFATAREVTNAEGDVLYTHTPADSAVRGPGGVGEGDPPQPLSPSTDGAGNLLLLSSLRIGLLAPSVELYILSPRTEVLKCTGLGKYAKYSRVKNIGEILLMKPIKNTVEEVMRKSADDLGEDASGELTFVEFGGPGLSRTTGRMWGTGYITKSGAAAYTDYLEGEAWYNFSTKTHPVTPFTVHRAFTSESKSEVKEERSDLIGLGGADGVFEMQYVASLDYPDEIYWRGGVSTWTYDAGVMPRVERFTKHAYRIRRADSRRSTVGKPEVYLTSWDEDNLKIFFGKVESKMTGHSYWDRHSATYAGSSLTPFTPGPIVAHKYAPTGEPSGDPPPGGWPEGTPVNFNVEGYAADLAADQRPMLQGYWDQQGVDVLASESYDPIKQTVDYTLTARHVLDYDHRGEFWAAIEVEVKCAGYLAKNPGISREARYEHLCYVVDDPTYTITFSFVAKWGNPGGGKSSGGDGAKKVLKTFSGLKKPLFEAPIVYMTDPYDWPPGVPETFVEYANMTHIAPPASVMTMIENIAKHQGMNTNFVGVNRYADDSADFISERGVEHSYIKNGREIPHGRRSAGMLYARDISIQDLMHVEWLLRATTCDAPRYNNWRVPDPIPWYYMPAVGEFLGSDEKWHIEMRDGAIVDWSNDIPDAPKDKFLRDIALYQT